ncbi:hypothetical protein FBY13_10550 [Pantoea sp. SJZ147]|nr:hypothetical protein FBY13_10550 [Pantoea sp. SJZ147]
MQSIFNACFDNEKSYLLFSGRLRPLRRDKDGWDVRCDLIKICNAFHKNISILRSKMIKYNLLFDEIKRYTPLAYSRPVYPCLTAFWG